MANVTIGGLTLATSAAAADWIELETVAGLSRKISKANFIGATVSGGGTIALGGYTFTVGGNSSINGNIAGSISGGGTLALGGFTLTVPASGTVGLLEVAQTFTAVKTFGSAPFLPLGVTIAPATINDDTAFSFTPASTTGIFFVETNGGEMAMIAYRTAATVHCVKVAGTANVNVTTGLLSGTTGTDARLTVSTHLDGKIYIENRLGGTISIKYHVMS